MITEVERFESYNTASFRYGINKNLQACFKTPLAKPTLK